MVSVGVVRCLAALAVAGVVWGIALAGAAQAQEQDDLLRLNVEISQLLAQGKYAQALPVAQRYVELVRQQYGEEHLAFANAIAWLGYVHRAQGRLADAVPLLRRSLAISERALGPQHSQVGTLLNDLAVLYQGQGRLADAEPLLRRSLAIREQTLGPDHPNLAQSLNNLSALYFAQGRYANAEPLLRRSLAISEKAPGARTPPCKRVAQQPGHAVPCAGPPGRGRAALPAQPRHP